ncbi:MAG: hypothetical protein ACUVQP_08555 [Bacteroidales bacterium]
MILNLLLPEETIAFYKGYVDIYKYKNKIYVGRTWPRKIKPPFSSLQATYQTVFSLSKRVHTIFSDNVLNAWRNFKRGSLPNWYDVIVSIFMDWYYLYKVYAPVVVNYRVEDNGSSKRVVFVVYYDYDINLKNGKTIEKTTDWLSYDYLSSFRNGIYLTLFNDDGIRLCAPWIPLRR